jgi:hypothetical protein
VTIFDELASRPTAARSTAEKIETDPERIAAELAKALREAGYECVIAPFDFSQSQNCGDRRYSRMPTFLFRCPNTGLNVQGYVADASTEGDSYQSITCHACTGVHLVNPSTGKVLGEDDDE